MRGPITYFDKSFLQSLSIEESAVFSFLYKNHLTPVLIAEVLADLEKEAPRGSSSENIVGRLAHKTAAMGNVINVLHTTLCTGDLLGSAVEMRGVPVVGRMTRVAAGEKKGYIASLSPESKAMERWTKREFYEVEQEFAKGWRSGIKNTDLHLVADHARKFLVGKRAKTLEDCAYLSRNYCNDGPGSFSPLLLSRKLFVQQEGSQIDNTILGRWHQFGKPTLPEFAPYAAYCTSIEMFFAIALGSDLISPERKSNRIDISYLFYLPFCQVFISSDKLHKKCARLFITNEQRFVWGPELKNDLKKINDYYMSLPENYRQRGLFHIAQSPPDSVPGVTSEIWSSLDIGVPNDVWNRFAPGNREGAYPEIAELGKEIREWIKAPESDHGVSMEDADFVAVEHSLPTKMGAWSIMPREEDD